ncbi:MAG: chaperone ATPase hsp78 [Geoglossum simile]|nr:MAG: chaperone ATPase hsp78 [Geoglossum simile]
MTIQIILESLRKETDIPSEGRRGKLEETLEKKQGEVKGLMEKWDKERAEIEELKQVKEELEKARAGLEQARRGGDFAKAKGRIAIVGVPLLHDSVIADDIANVVSRATGIPVSKLMAGEVEKLVRMEDTLRQPIRGQDEALTAVANAVRMQRAGLSGENRPLASFMFLDPTGVGKTELCKKMACFLFSSETAVVRFDTSEFQEKHMVSRLIGSPAGYMGYDDAGQPTEAVRRKPHAVLFLDEFEKAHRDISALLPQVLDEGYLTDSQDHKVDFRNTLIVLTSNLGADIFAGNDLLHPLSKSEAERDEIGPSVKQTVLDIVSSAYPPEFLNRIDEFTIFLRLSRSDIRLREF